MATRSDKEDTISVVKLVNYTISDCRVCSLNKECQNIFIMNYCDLTFADLFYYATRIELATEDNPYYICLMCVAKLLNAYEFIVQCEKAWFAQKQVRLSAQLSENNKQYKSIAPKPVTLYVDVSKDTIEATNQQEVIVITEGNRIIKSGDQILNVIQSPEIKTNNDNSSLNNNEMLMKVISNEDFENSANFQDDTTINVNEEASNDGQVLIKILPSEESAMETQSVKDDDDIIQDLHNELVDADVNSNYGASDDEPDGEVDGDADDSSMNSLHKCVKCEKGFMKIHALNKHLLDHLSGKHCCHICNKEYTNAMSFTRHVESHTSPDKHICEHCGKMIMKTSLKAHLERYHSDVESLEKKEEPELTDKNQPVQNYLCNVCGKTFTTLPHFKKHMGIHDERRRVSCTICNKVFSSRESLKQHVYTHTGIKPYQCDICGKRCTQSQQLKAHIRVHTGDKPYKCKFCENSFTTSATLKIHIRGRHLNDKPHVCTICKKRFIQKGPLERHLRLHALGKKSLGDGSVTCSLCENVFENRRELLGHKCPNMDLAPFECTECGKRFRIKPLLIVHQRIHTGETPFKCQYCPKAFRSKQGLKEHTYMHTGEKKYVCHICGKACVQRQHLVSHMRTHTGDRPYKCSECDSSFTLKGNLTVHMRTHTGVTPFTCQCGASYCTSTALKRHHIRCKLYIYEETANNSEEPSMESIVNETI